MAYAEYIGERYVPQFAEGTGVWNNDSSYDPLTIVSWTTPDGAAALYVSKTYVPPHVSVWNTRYWALWSGEKGEKGDKGDKGEKGDRGLQGLAGTNAKYVNYEPIGEPITVKATKGEGDYTSQKSASYRWDYQLESGVPNELKQFVMSIDCGWSYGEPYVETIVHKILYPYPGRQNLFNLAPFQVESNQGQTIICEYTLSNFLFKLNDPYPYTLTFSATASMRLPKAPGETFETLADTAGAFVRLQPYRLALTS